MDDNNFTYLDDILDLDEPGNENENERGPSNMYSHYSEPPPNMTTSHDLNSIRGNMSTHEMFKSKPTQYTPNVQYLPRSGGDSNKYGQYTPISKIENYNEPHSRYVETRDLASSHYNSPSPPPMYNQPTYPEPISLPSYSEVKTKDNFQLNDKKIQELTTKYDELCYICKKLNDNDRIRYHYIYNIIIIFLILVILLLIKKVLNI